MIFIIFHNKLLNIKSCISERVSSWLYRLYLWRCSLFQRPHRNKSFLRVQLSKKLWLSSRQSISGRISEAFPGDSSLESQVLRLNRLHWLAITGRSICTRPLYLPIIINRLIPIALLISSQVTFTTYFIELSTWQTTVPGWARAYWTKSTLSETSLTTSYSLSILSTQAISTTLDSSLDSLFPKWLLERRDLNIFKCSDKYKAWQ